MAVYTYTMNFIPDEAGGGTEVIEAVDYPVEDGAVEKAFEDFICTVDKLLVDDDERIMSWKGYRLCKRSKNRLHYIDSSFALTKEYLYIEMIALDCKSIERFDLSHCIGTQVFNEAGFAIPEFAVDFIDKTVYFLYNHDDIAAFEAEFRKSLGKYGHQDD